MISIDNLITKLLEIKSYYPDVPVDIDKIILHVSIVDNLNPIFITFDKDQNAN